jgi:hypothetical protein
MLLGKLLWKHDDCSCAPFQKNHFFCPAAVAVDGSWRMLELEPTLGRVRLDHHPAPRLRPS